MTMTEEERQERLRKGLVSYWRMVDDLMESIGKFIATRYSDQEEIDLWAEIDTWLTVIETKAKYTLEFSEELEELLPDDNEDGEENRVEAVSRPYLSLAAAADRAGLSVSTLRNQIHAGRLQAEKIGRNWVTTPIWLFDYLNSRKYNAKRTASRQRQR